MVMVVVVEDRDDGYLSSVQISCCLMIDYSELYSPIHRGLS